MSEQPQPVFIRLNRANEVVQGIGRATIYRLIKKKRLTLYKVGSSSFLKRDELVAIMQPSEK